MLTMLDATLNLFEHKDFYSYKDIWNVPSDDYTNQLMTIAIEKLISDGYIVENKHGYKLTSNGRIMIVKGGYGRRKLLKRSRFILLGIATLIGIVSGIVAIISFFVG